MQCFEEMFLTHSDKVKVVIPLNLKSSSFIVMFLSSSKQLPELPLWAWLWSSKELYQQKFTCKFYKAERWNKYLVEKQFHKTENASLKVF